MADPSSVAKAQSLFGRLAVERGYVSQAQLDLILRMHEQLGGTHPLGALFVQRGFMTIAQVQEVISIQKQVDARQAAQRPYAGPPATQPPPPAHAAAPAPVAAPAHAARPAIAPAQPPPAMAQHKPSPAPAVHASPPLQPPAAHASPPPQPPAAQASPQLQSPQPQRPALEPISFAPDSPRKVGLNIGAMSNLVVALIEAAEKREASDIHFHPGEPPVLRIEGLLFVVDQPAFNKAEQERELLSVLTGEQRQQFTKAGDLDFAYVSPNGLRTRANLYRTNAGVDATFRLLPRAPQTLEELNLPRTLARLVSYHQGLVLVTGPAGAGKSTTLAALVHLMNDERAEHILLMEDPIEIVHGSARALINQRQVGRDTESFARALRGALREDPDIIVIGDLRDRDTISLAITAAETGHLVIGSMNTNNAARTMGRLIDAFPPVQQGQVRAQLSESLRGVVSQKLIRGVDGRRVPATELLFNNSAMANVIRKGELFQIRSQLQVGRSQGMRTLDESLKELVASGKVDLEEARRHAESPAHLTGGAPPPPPGPSPAASPAGGPLRPGIAPPARPSPFRPGQRS